MWKKEEDEKGEMWLNTLITPDNRTVQGVSAFMTGGVSAVITMLLLTIKTRLQVLDGDEIMRIVGKGRMLGKRLSAKNQEGLNSLGQENS